jgi:flagellin
MVINHNLPALAAYNSLTSNTEALKKAVSQLSTGLRINGASDDAAGLAISEKMCALPVQAANDTLTTQDRSYIQLEIDQLKEAIE